MREGAWRGARVLILRANNAKIYNRFNPTEKQMQQVIDAACFVVRAQPIIVCLTHSSLFIVLEKKNKQQLNFVSSW